MSLMRYWESASRSAGMSRSAKSSVGGKRLAHRDHGAIRVHHLRRAQALAIDAGDHAVQPVDDGGSAGHRAVDQPCQRIVGDADVRFGATGVRLRGAPVSEHPARKRGARFVLEHVAHRLRILAGGVLEPELRVELGVARLRLEPLHRGRAQEQLVHPIRLRQISLLLLDDPGLAVTHQRERALAPRHPDPRHGVQLLQQTPGRRARRRPAPPCPTRARRASPRRPRPASPQRESEPDEHHASVVSSSPALPMSCPRLRSGAGASAADPPPGR